MSDRKKITAMDLNSVAGRPENIDAVLDGLEKLWGNEGIPPMLAHEEPLDGLMLTLLSQNTNDKNRDKGFSALKARFPEWYEMAGAPKEEIENCIRPAGLANTKSARMLEILGMIHRDFGDYSLNALRGWDAGRVKEYLSTLPGIGAKTIACVMLFDLGQPAFPVDTHVARFCRRMEWVEEKTMPEKIQPLLENWVPQSRYLGGHVNIIEHGRGICKAQKPNCTACSIKDLCPFYNRSGAPD
jgi:endonuclease-3